MLFDTWGGVLTGDDYRRWSLASMRTILARLPHEHDGQRIPTILFTKGGSAWVAEIADSGTDGIGLDWTADATSIRAMVGARCAVQGNLDPTVLLAGEEAIRMEVGKVLAAFGEAPGHVFNLGHGISQWTPPEAVATVVETVHASTQRAGRVLRCRE